MELKTLDVIAIQWPVVFFLTLLSLLIYRTTGTKEFRFIAIGWFFNLAYLVFIHFYESRLSETFPRMVVTISDLFCSLFIFVAVKNSLGYTALPFLQRPLLKELLYVALFLAAALIRILDTYTGIKSTPPFRILNIPGAVIDATSFGLLAWYFRKTFSLSKGGRILIFGTALYALIQFASIFDNQSLPINLERMAFWIGLVSKVIIVVGLVAVTPTSREYANKKEIAGKLDDILGKTFHEITYPLKGMQRCLNEVMPSDERKELPKRDKLQESLIGINSGYNHILAIVGASMKLYETDTGNLFENDLIEVPKFTIENVSVNTLLQIAILKTKPLTSEQVEFFYEYASHCFVDCHSYQLVQVFMNVFWNAHESFNGQNGKISVKTRIRTLDMDGAETRKMVEVAIEDSGPGIEEANWDKIFIKGFSTKGLRKKRGFGLAIVREILERNKGQIYLEKNLTKDALGGACFIIQFPQSLKK